MPRGLLSVFILGLSFFCQYANAINAIHIQVGELETPAGILKNTQLEVDLQGKVPTLSLKAEVKPTNAPLLIPFYLSCGQFNTKNIGQVDCLEGRLIAKQINVPFSLHFIGAPNNFALDLLLNAVSFSDETGLRAGEKLSGQVKLAAKNTQHNWQWSSLIRWDQGELFWQPIYIGKAGNQFAANGTFKSPILNVENASLMISEVGKMTASAQINMQNKALENIKVSAKELDFSGLYTVFLKPMAEKSVFGNLAVSGKADWQFEIKNYEHSQFELNLRDANIEDKNGKFAFNHINAHLPWDYEQAKTIQLSYLSGHLLKIPLGNTHLSAEINRYSLTAPQLSLPILDGALNLTDLSAAIINDHWYWHLSMGLTPISMHEFSQALAWPDMQGKISGQVPQVSYAGKRLSMDGAMTFNVFNGTIGMNNLIIDDPLGVVPRLSADLSMRQLDLGELTRTYSFGRIDGKLDGDVKNMRLENWKPVHLDASLQTSEGKQLKKISQRAVENITALGGEGTAVTLQRTFLRFFKEFNYDKIGLSCKLRQDVCEMGGVESTATGYIIVKGKGIPAVNVNGYTQKISWSDLLARVERITDSNSKAIVK
ncbi:MAG: hypothetical protein EXR38_00440 [Methylotenera sp.]|nr:hypothetical protein [Methylotenera sp.]MSP98980.1 hypothetical protein [Methylotenera sp.]